MVRPGQTSADQLGNQALPRSSYSGIRCFEPHSQSSFGNPSSHHQRTFHGTPGHWHRGMQARGVSVTGGWRGFWSNCHCPSQGRQTTWRGGKPGISIWDLLPPSEQHGANKTFPTWSWPWFLQQYYRPLNAIGCGEWSYLESSGLSAWWRTPRSSKHHGGHCITMLLAISNIVYIGLCLRLRHLAVCQTFQPAPI